MAQQSDLDPQILVRPDGGTLAYCRSTGRLPGVVFLHGLSSSMASSKALALEQMCRMQGRAFLRYDATAHGGSSGEFAKATIGRWVDDALLILDLLSEGAQVLVGSSLGGWVALLAALRRRQRIAGVVATSPAVDFTEDVIWAGLSVEERRKLENDGVLDLPGWEGAPEPYRIGWPLIEEGRHHLLLRGSIDIDCPVRLIHGQADKDVPWSISLDLAQRLAAMDVEVVLVKSGDDRLWGKADLRRLCRITGHLLGQLSR